LDVWPDSISTAHGKSYGGGEISRSEVSEFRSKLMQLEIPQAEAQLNARRPRLDLPESLL
jgi:hypothetical protein